MSRVRPGWLVALCAAIMLVSAWLPWLINPEQDAAGGKPEVAGGHATAIAGNFGNMPAAQPGFGVGQLFVLLASTLIVAGAMAARGLAARVAASSALAISVLLVVLTVWYFRLYVYSPVYAGYGFYLAAAVAVIAVLLSIWAMAAAWSATARVS